MTWTARNAAIDTLYTTTWQLMREKAIDNIFGATPFWYYLNKGGKTKRTETGGRWIGIPLEIGTHRDAVRYVGKGSSGTPVDLSGAVGSAQDAETMTAAQYPWSYITVSVYRHFTDDAQNKGKSQIIDIARSKLSNAERTLGQIFEEELFTTTGDVAGTPDARPESQPRDSDGNAISPLDQLVSDDPQDPRATGAATPSGIDTVGGIDPATHTWWRNHARNMIDENLTLWLLPRMRTMFNDASIGSDTPNLIVTDQTSFENYEDEVLELKQIVNQTAGDASFETISFKGKPMVWSPSCPASKMYFLNTNYLEWIHDPQLNFEMTDWKTGRNDLDRVAQVIVAGNLVTSNRRMHGVIYNIGETT